MSLKQNVQQVLSAVEVEEESNLDRSSEQDTRLDINTVITRTSQYCGRIYDEQGFPILWIKNKYYTFSRFSIIKTGNILEVKFYEW